MNTIKALFRVISSLDIIIQAHDKWSNDWSIEYKCNENYGTSISSQQSQGLNL